jgi:hypothetical protein
MKNNVVKTTHPPDDHDKRKKLEKRNEMIILNLEPFIKNNTPLIKMYDREFLLPYQFLFEKANVTNLHSWWLIDSLTELIVRKENQDLDQKMDHFTSMKIAEERNKRFRFY